MKKSSQTEVSYGIIPVYISKDGTCEVLVIRHARNAHHRWFPKGHAEAGETPLQTAIRETREEVGIDNFHIHKEKMFEEHYSYMGKKHSYGDEQHIDQEEVEIVRTIGYFIGFADTQIVQVRPGEIEDYAWLPLDEVQERLTFPEIKRLFGEIKETLVTLQANAQD